MEKVRVEEVIVVEGKYDLNTLKQVVDATIVTTDGFGVFHNSEKLKLIRTLGGTKKDELTKIVLPSSVPLILSVMKVNIGLCLVGVIIGEFIGARRGLGYLIIYSSQTFRLSTMLMSIIILCVIAMMLYAVLNFIEERVQSR